MRYHPPPIVVFVLTASAVLFAAAAPAPAQRPPTKDTVRVMPMGDSITRGYGSVDSGGYRKYLYNRLVAAGWNFEFVGNVENGHFPDPEHEGHDGSYIRTVRDQWTWGPQQTYDPEITLLTIGTNDMWRGVGSNAPQYAPQNLDSLIGTIFAANPDTHLFVASIPRIWDGANWTEYANVPVYNATIPGIVQSWALRGKAIDFVDVYRAVSVHDLIDGVHPNDEGYSDMADAFFTALAPPPQFKHGRRFDWDVVHPVPEPAAAAVLILLVVVPAGLRPRA